MPRYKLYENNLQFPKIEEYSYLLEYLSMIGYHINGSPITFQEIESFKRSMSIDLTSIEVETLVTMSREYVRECMNTDENAMPPYMEEERQKIPQSVLKARFGIKDS